MTGLATRLARVVAATALTGLSYCTVAPAQAVTPPQIDDKWLPEPTRPAPPQPTVQRETCAIPAAAAGSTQVFEQVAGLDLPRVWQLTRGSGQRVAVIDTGVATHRRLRDVVAGGDYVSRGDGTQDCDGHGTVVAGIIAAQPDPARDGFTGVAPDSTLISIRQSSTKFGPGANPSNVGVGDVDTLAKAVRTAADLGASVINISTVACVRSDAKLDDRALGAALAYAVDTKNAVIVAAAGNTGGAAQCPVQSAHSTWDTVAVAVSPAWYDDYVLTVGSLNNEGEPSSFSLAGPWLDVAAPGEAVTSLSLDGDGLMTGVGAADNVTPLTGTSYAAPVVSGVAALIRSRFPALTARQVMQRLKATAHHPPGGWNPQSGNGMVDALAAVSTDAPPPTTPPPQDKPMAISPSPTRPPAPAFHRSRRTALTGASICLAVLGVALATGLATARLRQSGSAARSDGNGVARH